MECRELDALMAATKFAHLHDHIDVAVGFEKCPHRSCRLAAIVVAGRRVLDNWRGHELSTLALLDMERAATDVPPHGVVPRSLVNTVQGVMRLVPDGTFGEAGHPKDSPHEPGKVGTPQPRRGSS